MEKLIWIIHYRQQEVIRLLAFRLIGVLVVAMVDKKVAGSSFLGTSKATAEFQRVEKIRVNHVFSVMSESVSLFPFSDAVRATIFDILLGEACPKQVDFILVRFLIYDLCQVGVSFFLLNCKHSVSTHPGPLT